MNIKLNDIQAAAAADTDGPIMVIAGPGTGKTAMISARIAGMIKSDQGINPEMILATTFTESGATAMRKRLFEYIGPESYKITVSTIHALCHDIVSSNLDRFGVRNVEPVSELERIDILYQMIDNLPHDHPLVRIKGNTYFEAMRLKGLFHIMKSEAWDSDYINDRIRAYLKDLPNREEYIYKRANKNKGIKVGDVKVAQVDKQKTQMITLTAAAKLLPRYNELLKENERYDYDDMVGWVTKAFKEDDQFLQTYQEKWQYILVDESQDQAGMHAELVNALIGYWDKPNVAICLDEDQTILEFLGARMKNITEFKHRYNPNIYVLNENYRSTQAIIDVATNLINHNTERLVGHFDSLTKDLIAVNNPENTTNPHAMEFPNPMQESSWIADKIVRLHEEGAEYKDIAVLYRKHKQADDIKRMLSSRGIPINIKKPINVLDQVLPNQILLILEYVSELAETGKPVSIKDSKLFKILHFGFMGIDRRQIEACVKTESIVPEIQEKLEIFFELTDLYHNESFLKLFEHLTNKCGVLKYIMNHDGQQQLIKELNALFMFVKSEFFKDPLLTGNGLINRVERMRKEKIPISTLDINYQEDGVTLSTAHGSKGLEYGHVIIMGVVAQEWERSRGRSSTYSLPDTLTFASVENKLESARRLMFVAMSRAKQSLHVTYHLKTASGTEVEASRFIDEAGLTVHYQKKEMDIGTHFPHLIAPQKWVPGLEKEQLDRFFENYKISVSHVNKYLKCPIQFYYENVVKVAFTANEALIFGNSIHIALQFLFNGLRDDRIIDLGAFIGVFKAELSRNMGQISKAAYERRLQEGIDSLTYYYTKVLPTENRVTVNEYKVHNIEIDGVPCTYIFDKIEFEGNEADMVDYKTGLTNYFKKNIRPANLEKGDPGGGYYRQMVMGKLVMDRITWKAWRARNAYMLLFDDGVATRYDIDVSKEDEKVVVAQIKDAYDNIMSHNFEVGCGEDSCDWCQFVKHLKL